MRLIRWVIGIAFLAFAYIVWAGFLGADEMAGDTQAIVGTILLCTGVVIVFVPEP